MWNKPFRPPNARSKLEASQKREEDLERALLASSFIPVSGISMPSVIQYSTRIALSKYIAGSLSFLSFPVVVIVVFLSKTLL